MTYTTMDTQAGQLMLCEEQGRLAAVNAADRPKGLSAAAMPCWMKRAVSSRLILKENSAGWTCRLPATARLFRNVCGRPCGRFHTAKRVLTARLPGRLGIRVQPVPWDWQHTVIR